MSLKAFHVFFVAVCLLVAIGFGVWSLREYRASSDTQLLWMGLGSFAACIVLGVYGAWFLRKLRGVSFV